MLSSGVGVSAPVSAVSISLPSREILRLSAFLGQRTWLMRFDNTIEAVTDTIDQKRICLFWFSRAL